jgi:hypothetical protein
MIAWLASWQDFLALASKTRWYASPGENRSVYEIREDSTEPAHRHGRDEASAKKDAN